MAAIGFPDMVTVINVLTQGKELTNELKRKLPPSMEACCDTLVESIVSSYNNALTLLPLIGNGNGNLQPQVSVASLSSDSIEHSSPSGGSDQNPKNSKKRKTLPKWSEQVRVGFESPLDDGYSWRKYGQKDILGSVHPRAYYRCSHRHTQGCLATKQVQLADDDPTVTEVNYKGKHSCRQDRLKHKKEEEVVISHPQPIETRQVDTPEESFPAFSFSENAGQGPAFFPDQGNFAGTGYSSPFLSPATSDSYFSLNDFGICLPGSESDFAEIVSNPTPFMNFSFGDMDIPIPYDQVNFSSDLLEALDGF